MTAGPPLWAGSRPVHSSPAPCNCDGAAGSRPHCSPAGGSHRGPVLCHAGVIGDSDTVILPVPVTVARESGAASCLAAPREHTSVAARSNPPGGVLSSLLTSGSATNLKHISVALPARSELRDGAQSAAHACDSESRLGDHTHSLSLSLTHTLTHALSLAAHA
jgi:hypothetical protein